MDPGNVKIVFELSKNQFKLDSLNQALQTIENALTLEKTNWQLHRLKGDILFKKQDYLTAILSFLDAISNGDKSILVKKKLGFCYYSDNNFIKCKNTFEKILEQDNEDPIILYYLGLCCNHLKEYDLTIDYMHATINAIYPDYMDNIYSILAESYYKNALYQEAVQYFRKALEFAEKEEVIYYQLANVY